MVSAIVKKILWSIPLLLLVSMIMFGVIHMLPGNAALVMLGDAGGSAEQVQKLEESRPIRMEMAFPEIFILENII